MPLPDVDVALVGAGGAGLTVLHRLAVAVADGAVPPAGRDRWGVAVVDDVDRLTHRPQDRTWCFWAHGPTLADAAVSAAWGRVVVRGPRADVPGQVLDLAPLRYAMVRSADYYALVADAVAAVRDRLDVVRVPAATSLVERAADVVVRTGGGDLTATWVLDSRPGSPAEPPVTALLQHFRGVLVETVRDVFDPDLPLLMDFRTPQPARGVSFGYCLPVGPRRALVEYTEFSRVPLSDAQYEAAVGQYLGTVLGGAPFRVVDVEQGAIPMTDARHVRRVGRRLMRTGTAGGATRPSTGYTFRAMQRQADGVVEALVAGRAPVPPRPYPRRHALLDAAMLRALDAGHVDGPDFFVRLFARNPARRVLDVLDGASGPASELALMASSPWAPMGRSMAEAVALRVLRRRPDRARRAGRSGGGEPGRNGRSGAGV